LPKEKKKNNTVELIARQIREDITKSSFKSSQHLKEGYFVKKFGVSRVPVREAFRILHSEGYIDMIPNKGSFVKKITKKDIEEIALIYKLLAPVVLDAAIPNYKKSTYKQIEEIIIKVEHCKDFSEVGYFLWEFAKTIFGPSKLTFFLELFDKMYRNNIRSLNEIFEASEHKQYDTSDHREFLRLCKLKKKKEAIDTWTKHISKIESLNLKLRSN